MTKSRTLKDELITLGGCAAVILGLYAGFAALHNPAKTAVYKQEAQAKAEKKAKDDAAWEKRKKEQAVKAKAEAAAKREEKAKLKADGWWEQIPGVYVRWCTRTCDNSKVIGDAKYALMEVWARGRNASIYAETNLLTSGTVVGYTNDTLRLQKGQKGVMAFDSYQAFEELQLTEFSVR